MAILRLKNADGSWVDVPEIHGENAYEGAVRNGYTGTEQEFYDQLSNFTTYADEAEAAATLAQEIKESIPQDYTDLSNRVDNITDHIIEVTDTQPISEENKLWIQDDEQVQEVQVPTYEEFEELRDSVAPIEENSTFSKGYSKGESFIHDGGLYVTTIDVAQGDTITVGTNCSTVPGGVTGEVADLKSAITQDENNILDLQKTVGQSYSATRTVSHAGTLNPDSQYDLPVIAKSGARIILTLNDASNTGVSVTTYLKYKGSNKYVNIKDPTVIGTAKTIIITNDIEAVGFYNSGLTSSTITMTADVSYDNSKLKFSETEFPQLLDKTKFVVGYCLANTYNVSTPDDYLSASAYTTFNEIDVTPGEILCTNMTSLTDAVILTYMFDGNNFVRKTSESQTKISIVDGHGEYTVPANSEKLKMYVKTADIAGIVPIITRKDNYDTDKPFYVGKDITILYNTEEKPKFYGKSICGIGDSIMSGVEGGDGGFLAQLKYLYPSITVANFGVAGTSVAQSSDIPANVSGKCIYDRFDDISSDYDYILVEGGINDHSYASSIPYGDWETNWTKMPVSAKYNFATRAYSDNLFMIDGGNTASLDPTTFCGAFEALLIKLSLRSIRCKVGVIIPHLSTNATVINEQYFDVETKLCHKYGIPVLDMRHCAGMPRIYQIANKTDGSSMFTVDGVHPNNLGYLNRYCPKIASWLNTL